MPLNILEKTNQNILVNNWKKGWKWVSSWTFAVIAYIAINGIPPEIMALIPEASKDNVIGTLAVIGLIFRFINQSKDKNTPFFKGNS